MDSFFANLSFIIPAVLKRSRKCQPSHIIYLREGDANTKSFHLHVNSRCRKNVIQRLKHNEGWVANHLKKGATHSWPFLFHPGSSANWHATDPICEYLDYLGLPFSKDEIEGALMDLPPDKALWPDGFTSKKFGLARPSSRTISCRLLTLSPS